MEQWESTVQFLIEFGKCFELGAPLDHMATFQVYCDESGHLSQNYVVFAACVFSQDETVSFARKWQEILRDARVKYVTMKEAMGFRGQFGGWKANDRDALLETLTSLVQERCVFHTHSSMTTESFRALHQTQQQRLKGIVYAGFETLIRFIADEAVARNQSHRFQLVCDLSEEYAEKTLKLFQKLRMQTIYKRFFPSLAFAADEEFPQLQAADLIAFCRKEELLNSSPVGIVGKMLDTLGAGGPPKESALLYGPAAGIGEGTLELLAGN
jgi:hypothetical protein